eukprot:snap_masked-scaffold_49-processed-gene-1.86-mRNA-1 protein AED:1.00 eAED:1.00 QI:0/-1/0/0/-1/1/1/0/70
MSLNAKYDIISKIRNNALLYEVKKNTNYLFVLKCKSKQSIPDKDYDQTREIKLEQPIVAQLDVNLTKTEY